MYDERHSVIELLRISGCLCSPFSIFSFSFVSHVLIQNMQNRTITILAPDVVRKLAAGEYLLRPASAAKELIENSLDAKATSIKITVKNGGMKYLQVLDNGSGICKEDLDMLCERHTTSKLKTFEELNSISTYGFRGEAMASISAVAHVSVTTKTAESRCGYEVSYLEGTMKGNPMPCGTNKGTQITVENMFYNMPLRQKGLQKFAEEFKKVEKVVSSYAVHNPSVSFMLKKLGQKDVNIITPTNSTTLKNIEIIFGTEISRNLLEEKGVDELLQFKYHIVATNLKYSSPSMKFLLFVNHRLVNANGLKEDVTNLYNIYLPQKRKPFVYISLEMNPQNIDVNVHPSKEEVFYLHEDAVNKKIISVVKHLLTGKEAYKAYQEEIESLISADCESMCVDNLDCVFGETSQPFDSDAKKTSSESFSKTVTNCKVLNGHKETLAKSKNSSDPILQSNNNLEGFIKDISLLNSFGSFNPPQESTNVAIAESSVNCASLSASCTLTKNASSRNRNIGDYFNRSSLAESVPTEKEESLFSSRNGNIGDYLNRSSLAESVPAEKEESLFSSRNRNIGDYFNRSSLAESVPTEKEESLFSSVSETSINSVSPSSTAGITKCKNMGEGSGKTQNLKRNENIDRKKQSMIERESCNESISSDSSVSSLGILKMNIVKNCNHLFKNVLRQSTFVKCEDFQYLFIQEGSIVYSCDLKYFCQEYFYQLVLDNFQRHRILRFSEPAPLKLLLQVAAKNHSPNWDVKPLVKRLTSAAILLEDFFSIIIDKEGNLQSIPWLLEEYLPSKKHLPFFMLNLATKVQWDSEFSCIDGVSRQIAKYYSQLPSVQDPFISTSEWNSFVQNSLFQSLKDNILPSKNLCEKYISNVIDIDCCDML